MKQSDGEKSKGERRVAGKCWEMSVKSGVVSKWKKTTRKQGNK
jgi:hypothetical protein